MIQWSSELATGVSKIDFQHQHLINIVNNLEDAAKEENPEVRDLVIKVTLEQLLAYTVEHFDLEERLMEKTKYPDLTAHRAEHEALKKKAIELVQRFENKEDVMGELLNTLAKWLRNHIMGVDMKMAPKIATLGEIY